MNIRNILSKLKLWPLCIHRRPNEIPSAVEESNSKAPFDDIYQNLSLSDLLSLDNLVVSKLVSLQYQLDQLSGEILLSLEIIEEKLKKNGKRHCKYIHIDKRMILTISQTRAMTNEWSRLLTIHRKLRVKYLPMIFSDKLVISHG